jgi:transcription elongation factor Elf1
MFKLIELNFTVNFRLCKNINTQKLQFFLIIKKKKQQKYNNMKCTSATQFDICQMKNRTDLYNNWTSL